MQIKILSGQSQPATQVGPSEPCATLALFD
jgi:hypothetical protein